jgi:predicted ATPase
VDAERFESLFREGSDLLTAGDARRAAALLSQGLGLWRGPALADLRYEGFAQVEAGRLDELRLACQEERIEAELQLGHHAELVAELEALTIEQPLRERLRGQLILSLYRSGRQSEALAQYQAARRMLSDELGLEPSPELRELERMILSHDPGLAAPPTLSVSPSTVPLQPTPFIGREQELAELLGLIRGGRRRFVTLTGAGGSGKTRLAIEAASRLLPEFRDGVWWVALQALADPQLVLPTIADAIDANGDLTSHICDRRMLILTDNFEHLLDAGPDVAALLTRCPGLFVLTTSREPLHVAAEREYRVLPMTMTDAVALFDERTVEPAAEGVVADICERLDCLPLAVELAARRTGALTPEQILMGLDERLSSLGSGPRDAPVRQQTLRATIEWSYELLTPAEQRLFAQLSVFAGSWSLPAADAVCRLDDERLTVEGGLAAMIEKSIIDRPPDDEGRTRYSMLQTIREYAVAALDASGERPSVRRRHAEYFLDRFGRVTRMRMYGDVSAGDEDDELLADDLPNLGEALSFALEEGDHELALGLAGRGGMAWTQTGATVEGQAWLRRVLDETEQLQTPARAEVLLRLASVEQFMGNFRGAEELCEEAGRLFECHGDRGGVLQALISVIELGEMTKDLDQRRNVIRSALEVADGLEPDFSRARILFWAADVENTAGDYARADALLDEALELVRELGVPQSFWAWQLVNIGWLAMQRGDYARAKGVLQDYIEHSSLKYPNGIAIAHGNLGVVALHEHQRDVADANFGRSLELAP